MMFASESFSQKLFDDNMMVLPPIYSINEFDDMFQRLRNNTV